MSCLAASFSLRPSAYLCGPCVEMALNRRERRGTQRFAEKAVFVSGAFRVKRLIPVAWLVRGLIERLAKQTQEMITRETSLLRDLVQAQRMVVAMIDKITRTTQPLERFEIGFDSSHHYGYGFGGKGFCNAAAMNSVMPASLPSWRNL